MTQPDNPDLREQILDFTRQHPDETLSWVEIHGLLCALACGPVPDENWPAMVSDLALPETVHHALLAQRERLHARLGLGEGIQLPCRLDPYEETDGQDLASWCAGFMAGVSAAEEHWHKVGDDRLVELLLPFLLISGVDEDPELDRLWQDTRLVRQMALGIPELLEEIFLLYHAPADAEGSAETDDDA